jgi:endonuclease/exonuclease/phosphatase family metal-dependent hydrolase
MDIVSRITQSLAILTIASTTMSSLALNPDVVEQPQSDALVEQYQKARDMMRQYGLENAPAKAEQSFRLTTYNIENLFDAHDDPSLTGRNDDADETKPEHELTATAMAIRAVNPDVLCIQEVESEAALLEYRDNYLSDMGYEYVVSIDAGNDRGIENSVLSRFPISNVQNWPNMPLGGVHPEKYGTQKNWYAGEPINFRRSPLMVDLEIPSSEDGKTWTLTLFVMHHKSGRFNTYWREAEATGTLKLIKDVLAADKDRAIVLLGDFNAEVDDQSVQTYLKGGFVDIFADHTSKTETITHESGRRIDLILANKAALSRMNPESAFVYGTAARPEGVNWRDMETFDGYAADHYPVSVDVKY